MIDLLDSNPYPVIEATLPYQAAMLQTFCQKMNRPRPSDEELRGMTVNERLFACGLLDDYGAAASRRDRAKMIELLMQAAATREQAESTVDTTLLNPSKYGY